MFMMIPNHITKAWPRFLLGLSCVLMVLGLVACGSTQSEQNSIIDSAPTRLAETPTVDMTQRLVYSADGDLVIMPVSGQGIQYLGEPNTMQENPAWTPDGKYIVFEANNKASSQIMIAPITNIGDVAWHTQLSANGNGYNYTPAIAPNGLYAAYSSFRDGYWSITLANFMAYEDIDSPVIYNELRLTYNKFFEGHPAWSPDGQWIAFTSDQGIRWQIFRMDPTGANYEAFPGTGLLSSTAYPAWSPDGEYLAFASTHNGSWDIYTIKVDGTDPRQLTEASSNDWAPAWSPDGKWIAFVSDRGGQQDLYMINPDATRLVQLTNDMAAESRPAWMP